MSLCQAQHDPVTENRAVEISISPSSFLLLSSFFFFVLFLFCFFFKNFPTSSHLSSLPSSASQPLSSSSLSNPAHLINFPLPGLYITVPVTSQGYNFYLFSVIFFSVSLLHVFFCLFLCFVHPLSLSPFLCLSFSVIPA